MTPLPRRVHVCVFREIASGCVRKLCVCAVFSENANRLRLARLKEKHTFFSMVQKIHPERPYGSLGKKWQHIKYGPYAKFQYRFYFNRMAQLIDYLCKLLSGQSGTKL